MVRKPCQVFVANWLFFFFAQAIGACAGSKPAPDQPAVQQPAPASDGQMTPARLVESTVEEKNLLLPGRTQAVEYLRTKLVGLLAQRLVSLGFETATASRMAASGRLVNFEVNGHREKFAGQGTDQGRIVQAELWDVRGQLQYSLTDRDLEHLCQILVELPADSVEAAEKLASLLQGVEKLQAPTEMLLPLKERLADGWAKSLSAELQVLRDLKKSASGQPPPELSSGTERLKKFVSLYAALPSTAELSRYLGQAWLRWLQDAGGDGQLSSVRPLLRLFREQAAGLPEVLQYVEKAVELAWRDRLEKLDTAGAPFSATREEFLVFLEEFPASRFFADLELRFAARWVEHLLSVPVPDLTTLEAFEHEVRLLGSRFPTLSRREEVSARAGGECLKWLAAQKPADLNAMAELRRVLKLCDPYLPASLETSQLRVKLDEMEQQLVRQRDDTLERQALKDLNFFITWEKAIRSLKWGAPSMGWQGQGDFARLWAQGRDAGADCHCSLDPEEPCRLFEEQSPRGGFEVVARFHQGKLAGIDLCNIYVGGGLPAVYNFFSRRYPRSHKPAQASHFLSAGDGEVGFGKSQGLRWWLSCGGGTCVVRARDGRLFEAMRKQQNEEKQQLRSSLEEQRRRRIEKGWGAGDCVRWDCAGDCGYEGKVQRREGARYLVTVENSLEDPRQVGSRRWVEEEELYDCQ